MDSQPCDQHIVTIQVEPEGDGYVVWVRKDGEDWLRHGPYDDLEYANSLCVKLLAHARLLVERLEIKHNQ
jgi:hypothetical protein